jgi:hypothetical protein
VTVSVIAAVSLRRHGVATLLASAGVCGTQSGARGDDSDGCRLPVVSARARLGLAVTPPWFDLDAWSQHWTVAEWLQMLNDGSGDEVTRVELQEATLSGLPLGHALVERPEKELGRRLRRGKAGRPPRGRASAEQVSLFGGTV